MGKATFKGLQTDPLSNESFVLLGGPSKKPSKQNSKDAAPKAASTLLLKKRNAKQKRP